MILTVVACCNHCFSQITIANPSFEKNIVWNGVIANWDTCTGYYTAAVQPTPDQHGYFPPPNGTLYGILTMDGYTPYKFTYITTKLSCPTVSGNQHQMSLWAIGYIPHYNPQVPQVLGYFSIHLGYTSCDSVQCIYTSQIMPDTLLWHKYEFSFIPNGNYNYIGIQIHHVAPNTISHILIDDFSPISVFITGKAQIKITGFDKHSCYTLEPQLPNDITATRYEWTANGNIISTASQIQACANEYKTISLTAYDACGYGYVDTLNLINGGGINTTYANNGNTLHLQIANQTEPATFALFNALGQLILTKTIESNTTEFEIDIANLPSGIYFSTLQTYYGWLVKKWLR